MRLQFVVNKFKKLTCALVKKAEIASNYAKGT